MAMAPFVGAASPSDLFLSDPHNHSQAIRLNPNGGYDIVIAVEDNTPEPINQVNFFLDEIRVGIDSFSTELWKATKGRFFINKVDVLIPGNWWTFSNHETATWQTLKGSEIRITSEVSSPNVVNPNPCGNAGLHVDLPSNFFKPGGEYGATGKALTNLWARYRYGVWEEHGIPGDIKFPYFYTHPSFQSKWEATGCSNEELKGTFETIDGEESERCNPYGARTPADDCRFVPSPDNTANSSLLQFHWLDSIVSFCDSGTHNHAAPNRQNLLCSHRSVWEVIRESEDYKSTKTCMESVNRPEFRVLKESRSPEFYLLIDRGSTITPEKVLREVMGAMDKFIGFPSFERINIAVGTYPHPNQGKSHYYVKEEIGWAPIYSVIYEVQRILSESANPEGPVIRDFGLAIQEVAEKIKRRNHLAGTVILVIKRGAGPNTFDKLTYEQEVIASLKEDSRITVFAIESEQGSDTPFANLQSLVEEASGKYHLINDTVNTAKKLEPLLKDVQVILEQSSIMGMMATKSSWVTQKQLTEPGEVVSIPIYDDVTSVKIHLTASRKLTDSDIILASTSDEHDLIMRIDKAEWDENSDPSSRIVYTFHIRNPKQDSEWTLSHGCHSENPADCRFFLIVVAESNRLMPRDMTLPFSSRSINIDVATSAEYNYVDMHEEGSKIVPFSIFATIEMDRQRVLGLENVTALIRLGGVHDDQNKDWVIQLVDDGSGLPDVSANDGIYSAVFTPLEDGLYQISVSASGISQVGGSSFQNIRVVQHAGALMPQDQLNFGCKNSSMPRCVSAVPRGSFSRVQDLSTTVAVENAATFKAGKPMKILDFTVTTLPNYNVEFEFTSPKLFGSDDSPDEFWIYMAPHIDNFVGSTDLTKVLIKQVGAPSGMRVTIPYNAMSAAIPYYAVEAIHDGQRGGPSNVVGVVTSESAPLLLEDSDLILPSHYSTTFQTSSDPTTEFSRWTTSSSTETTSSPPSTPVPITEFPWPSTAPTTESPYPTTTEESEEWDEPEPELLPSSSSTTESPVTSSTTHYSSTGNDGIIIMSSSSTTEFPSTTGEDLDSTSESSMTPPPSLSTTTGEPEMTLTVTSSTSTEGAADILASGSTSTEGTSELPNSSSTSTEGGADILAASSTTTEGTTEMPNSSSTSTEGAASILASSSTSTEAITETPNLSSSSTEGATEMPSSSSTSTTESPPILLDIAYPASSSSTTESPNSTPDEDIPSSTATESSFPQPLPSSTPSEIPMTITSSTESTVSTIEELEEPTSSPTSTTESLSTSTSPTPIILSYMIDRSMMMDQQTFPPTSSSTSPSSLSTSEKTSGESTSPLTSSPDLSSTTPLISLPASEEGSGESTSSSPLSSSTTPPNSSSVLEKASDENTSPSSFSSSTPSPTLLSTSEQESSEETSPQPSFSSTTPSALLSALEPAGSESTSPSSYSSTPLTLLSNSEEQATEESSSSSSSTHSPDYVSPALESESSESTSPSAYSSTSTPPDLLSESEQASEESLLASSSTIPPELISVLEPGSSESASLSPFSSSTIPPASLSAEEDESGENTSPSTSPSSASPPTVLSESEEGSSESPHSSSSTTSPDLLSVLEEVSRESTSLSPFSSSTSPPAILFELELLAIAESTSPLPSSSSMEDGEALLTASTLEQTSNENTSPSSPPSTLEQVTSENTSPPTSSILSSAPASDQDSGETTSPIPSPPSPPSISPPSFPSLPPTPSAPSSSLSTSDQGSGENAPEEIPPTSSAISLVSSETLLGILMLICLYIQRTYT